MFLQLFLGRSTPLDPKNIFPLFVQEPPSPSTTTVVCIQTNSQELKVSDAMAYILFHLRKKKIHAGEKMEMFLAAKSVGKMGLTSF